MLFQLLFETSHINKNWKKIVSFLIHNTHLKRTQIMRWRKRGKSSYSDFFFFNIINDSRLLPLVSKTFFLNFSSRRYQMINVITMRYALFLSWKNKKVFMIYCWNSLTRILTVIFFVCLFKLKVVRITHIVKILCIPWSKN